MNKRIKKLWIKALRSGKYKQGRDKLRQGRGDNRTYCCLGVLESLHCAATGKPFRRNPHGETLSQRTAAWAGIDRNEGDAMVESETGSNVYLATLNDTGYSFDRIADRIEKHL